MSIELVMPSNHLIHCRTLLLPPSVFPNIMVFSNKSVLHIRWPKYWSFHFSISPSNEYSGWISFRMDWLDLLAVQGTLKSLFQYHSLKASILQCSAFFVFSSVQFSSVTQSCPTLRPHESQYARSPCLSSTPGVHSNSCLLSWSCDPTISSSVVPFSSCLQSFPASGSFLVSQFFTSGDQRIRVSVSHQSIQ